jgi:hypothetical protein
MKGNQIVSSTDPVIDSHLANKGYVDKWSKSMTATASANIKNQNTAIKSTTSTTPVKLKEILINQSLNSVRVYCDLRSNNPPFYARYELYKNGVSVGATQQENGGISTTCYDDISTLVPGDLLQIYAWVSGGGGSAEVENMMLGFDVYANATNQDP